MTQQEKLIELVQQNPGKTAMELTALLNANGKRQRGLFIVERITSTLYLLSVKKKILVRRREPGTLSLPKLQQDPVRYSIFRLTGEGAGQKAWRYYPKQ